MLWGYVRITLKHSLKVAHLRLVHTKDRLRSITTLLLQKTLIRLALFSGITSEQNRCENCEVLKLIVWIAHTHIGHQNQNILLMASCLLLSNYQSSEPRVWLYFHTLIYLESPPIFFTGLIKPHLQLEFHILLSSFHLYLDSTNGGLNVSKGFLLSSSICSFSFIMPFPCFFLFLSSIYPFFIPPSYFCF